MTKVLSHLLEAPEPSFRQLLRKLEAANGHPNTDIRFSTELSLAAKNQLRELGLDPDDTTPEELYHALQERVKADDNRLNRTLRTLAATHISAEADVVAGMVHALKELPDSRRCFALKSSTFKSVIKKVPPKKAMKRLGYRSLDSFLKHESAASVLTAAYLAEDEHWHKRLLAQYKHLKAADFEDRSIVIMQPGSKRWCQLAEETVGRQKHNILRFKELAALVLLPLPTDAPTGSTLASLSLAAHALNEIRAGSTFLKLCQVRPDFGKVVQTAVADEPCLNSQLLDEAVPWHLIQRYYNRLARQGHHLAALEPHLQAEDISWQAVEKTLANIEPSLAFWQHGTHLGVLTARGPVSLNMVDAALCACNRLSFEDRMQEYFQRSLWHELLLRYLHHGTVEQAVIGELQPQLAEELVPA